MLDQTKSTFPTWDPQKWFYPPQSQIDNMTYKDMIDCLEYYLPEWRRLNKEKPGMGYYPREHMLKIYETLLILLKKELEELKMNPESKLVDMMTNYINQTDIKTFMELVLKAIESSDECSKKDGKHDN